VKAFSLSIIAHLVNSLHSRKVRTMAFKWRRPRSQADAAHILREADEEYEHLKQKKRLTKDDKDFVAVYELGLEAKRSMSREEAIKRFKLEEEGRAVLRRLGFSGTPRILRPH
jgi:hypothetical protein